MSTLKSFRLSSAELLFLNEEAAKHGTSVSNIIRKAIWERAAVTEIREQVRAAMQEEFDLLFAKIAADFSSEFEIVRVDIAEMREANQNELIRVGKFLVEQIYKLKSPPKEETTC